MAEQNDVKKIKNGWKTVAIVLFVILVAIAIWFIFVPMLNQPTPPPVPTPAVAVPQPAAQPPPPPKKAKEGITGKLDEAPIRAIGDIKPPTLIKQVEPKYPEIARQARVEGIVILEATTDVHGQVVNAKVLRSIPLLDQAAMDAVRQWIYEPKIINGKARSIIFTVTVRFTLK